MLEALLSIELLFARGKGEFSAAVTAGDGPVLKRHNSPQFSRFGKRQEPASKSRLCAGTLQKSSTFTFKKQPWWAVEALGEAKRADMNARQAIFRFSAVRWLTATGLVLVALMACRLQASALAPAAGSLAPTFALRSLAGPHWSLSDVRGHVVVVNFFATWCPPCRAETPDLVAIERRYASKGVIFVGVDDREDAALVSVFAKNKGIRFPIVLDSNGAVAHTYDVRAIPTTYVLDARGVIRYEQVDELSAAVLAGALDAVIAGAPVPESVASQKFHQTAKDATSSIQTDLQTANASPANPQALTSAVTTGVAANKKLDDMLSAPDSNSIGYFDAAATRDALNSVLADAYTARAGIANSATAVSDQVEAALLRGQVQSDQEHFPEALAQYETAVQLAPKDTRGYDGAYLAAYEQKLYAKAAQIADAEALLVPDDPESWLTVASAQNSLKNYPKALDAERKALALASQAYAKNPVSKGAAYELGRVWLKTARTQLLAGNRAAARPLLVQAQAAAPATIVEQQASEQFAALAPVQIAIEKTEAMTALGADAAPAKVYVVVRNPSSQSQTVNLKATGLPPKWLVSFCYSTVCNPYKVSFGLPAGGSKRIELLVAPLGQTNGPWRMSVSASGAATAEVHLDASTAKAAITISAT